MIFHSLQSEINLQEAHNSSLFLFLLGVFLFHIFQISTPQNAQTADELPSVIGQAVYATGLSRLFQQDATLEEMRQTLGTHKRYLTGWEAMDEFCRTRFCQARRIPLLVPLPITRAEYIAASHTVILRLKLPNGTQVLSSTNTDTIIDEDQSPATLLEQIRGALLTSIPQDLSLREIDAIRKRKPFVGMLKSAIYDMFGLPTAEKKSEKGTQLIYSDSFVVYLDRKDRFVSLSSPGLASAALKSLHF